MTPDRPPRLLELRGVEEALVLLTESPQLHRRAQRVFDFAVYAFRQQRRGTGEVLVNARRYLVRSRYYPQQQFLPTRTSGGLCLEWDQLELDLRRTVCAEVEVDIGYAENPAGALPVDLQDRISWRYELACRTRILFIPSSRPA